jgi:hypothetical protein
MPPLADRHRQKRAPTSGWIAAVMFMASDAMALTFARTAGGGHAARSGIS